MCCLGHLPLGSYQSALAQALHQFRYMGWQVLYCYKLLSALLHVFHLHINRDDSAATIQTFNLAKETHCRTSMDCQDDPQQSCN